jgi:hypothetical protein
VLRCLLSCRLSKAERIYGSTAWSDGHLGAREMIDRMIEIVPADSGKFRNVVPKAVEDMLKTHQLAAWENQI